MRFRESLHALNVLPVFLACLTIFLASSRHNDSSFLQAGESRRLRVKPRAGRMYSTMPDQPQADIGHMSYVIEYSPDAQEHPRASTLYRFLPSVPDAIAMRQLLS